MHRMPSIQTRETALSDIARFEKLHLLYAPLSPEAIGCNTGVAEQGRIATSAWPM